MTTARTGHTATVLQNGQVLVAGGGSSAELYHPATGTWTTTGSLNFPRDGQPAWLLPDGQVLVVCGIHDPGVPQCVAELYNPATGTWTQDGQASQSAARDFQHRAAQHR
jgi:hypothetical protein